jgi:hypothetical protein
MSTEKDLSLSPFFDRCEENSISSSLGLKHAPVVYEASPYCRADASPAIGFPMFTWSAQRSPAGLHSLETYVSRQNNFSCLLMEQLFYILNGSVFVFQSLALLPTH